MTATELFVLGSIDSIANTAPSDYSTARLILDNAQRDYGFSPRTADVRKSLKKLLRAHRLSRVDANTVALTESTQALVLAAFN